MVIGSVYSSNSTSSLVTSGRFFLFITPSYGKMSLLCYVVLIYFAFRNLHQLRSFLCERIHYLICSNLGPLHTRDWEPVTITLQALSLVEKAEPVQVHFILRLRDQRSMWMQDGCKVYMDSYMASNGSCFMVTWIIFKNHLFEVGLTQTQEFMAIRMLTTID